MKKIIFIIIAIISIISSSCTHTSESTLTPEQRENLLSTLDSIQTEMNWKIETRKENQLTLDSLEDDGSTYYKISYEFFSNSVNTLTNWINEDQQKINEINTQLNINFLNSH